MCSFDEALDAGDPFGLSGFTICEHLNLELDETICDVRRCAAVWDRLPRLF
ncbi:protein of unknown function (plasmid) [Cupriavidus neocaledonicus]|uniref:Uncharacterized protein n=1 Tax=Cupriavidus neocaledonicus TaxID=1040979 RepID=A0A375HPW1_9BURK|nr:protein of unknown function [Cupriavidus neocaledonicus]